MRGHEASTWYMERASEARDIIGKYEAFKAEVETTKAKIVLEDEAARVELAAVYLPELAEEGLSRMSALTGFNGLKRRNPIKAMQHERHVLQRRVAEIVADERYQRRRWLVGQEGELTRGRAEAFELFEPWQRDAVRFEDLDGFMELIDAKYDTPEFETDWWEPAYWRQWAAGDRICKELEAEDFGDDVLPEYRRVAAERDKWKAEVKRWDDRIAEVHGMVQEHDQAVARIPKLPELYLDGARRVLAGFLEHADAALLDEWCMTEQPPDRALRMGLRRFAGLKAKLQFLDELLEQGIAPAIQGFKTRYSKFERKVVKYRRNKHYNRTISQRELDKGFVLKRTKYHTRVDKLRKLVSRIDGYDNYERFELSNEPELWWMEMTGKGPNSFTPRLKGWYQRNQGVALEHDNSVELDDIVAGAAAQAVMQEDDIGYLS